MKLLFMTPLFPVSASDSVSPSSPVYMYNTTLELRALGLGTLTSLNYPLPYPSHAAISTTLTAPLGYQIHLTILQMDLGSPAPCHRRHTYVEFVDNYAAGQRVIGPFCDDDSINVTVISYMNSLVLEFVSGDTSQTGDYAGYLVHYSVVEGQFIDSGFNLGT